LIEKTNHMLPLQDPEGLAGALADFARRHGVVEARAQKL